MTFRVSLDVYRGPLDLLLFLVRKHEVDIVNLPVAVVTAQFLEYIAILEELNLDAVGDFVEMASTLAEIKSRMVLPHGDEVDEALPDPRSELVQQLLEYKRFKDAASMLEERGRAWQQRFPRATGATAMPERDPADEPIREVELWDLVSAFGRIVRSNEGLPSTNIIYDDTPIHVFMTRIRDRLTIDKPLPVGELFRPGMHKSTLVGIVLAILELVRDRTVRAEQKTLFGEIWLTASEDSGAPAPSDAT